MIDKTQKTRQQRRRKALNEAAQDAGYPSWSAYETAVLNGETHLTQRAADGGQAGEKSKVARGRGGSKPRRR